MTKEEFIAGYCERSGITPEFYHETTVTLPCACSDESCDGWAAICRDARSIKNHNMFYAPEYYKPEGNQSDWSPCPDCLTHVPHDGLSSLDEDIECWACGARLELQHDYGAEHDLLIWLEKVER